jgi:hypothetical protein
MILLVDYSPNGKQLLAINEHWQTNQYIDNLVRISLRSCERERILSGIGWDADWQAVPER